MSSIKRTGIAIGTGGVGSIRSTKIELSGDCTPAWATAFYRWFHELEPVNDLTVQSATVDQDGGFISVVHDKDANVQAIEEWLDGGIANANNATP